MKKKLNNNEHVPVLREEVKYFLNIREGKTYVDGTFGAGGHSSMILEEAKCNLFSIDRDPYIKKYAKGGAPRKVRY